MKRRKQIKRAALSTVVAGMVTAVTLAGGVTASAADATAFPTNTPDITSLLSEFYQWWAPKKIADPNNKNPQDSASNTAQGFAYREFSDALGGTIAGFVKEGLDSGALPKINALVFDNSSKTAFSKFVGTGSTKTDFNYPRPYTSKSSEGWDRTFDGANDLKDLKSELHIVRFPMFAENGT